CIADPPNRVRAIVAHQERPVFGHRNANGSSPNLSCLSDEAREEILVFASCSTLLMQWNSPHFIAGTHLFVPRAMLGRKDVTTKFSRKLLPFIERELERGIVRFEQHVRGQQPGPKLWMLILVARINVSTHVIPGPAIKAAVLHVCDVVRRQVVA